MAKKSMMAREHKRAKLTSKYADKRAQLKETMRTAEDIEKVIEAQEKLQKLPRDSSPARQVNRCHQCGRPHAVYKKFKLCRICLRKHLMQGDVTGGTKSSW